MSTVIVFNNTERLITLAVREGKLKREDVDKGIDTRPRTRVQFVPGLNSPKKVDYETLLANHKDIMEEYIDSGDLLVSAGEIKRASKKFAREDATLNKKIEAALEREAKKSDKAMTIINNNLAETQEQLVDVTAKVDEQAEALDEKDAKIAELQATLAGMKDKPKAEK